MPMAAPAMAARVALALAATLLDRAATVQRRPAVLAQLGPLAAALKTAVHPMAARPMDLIPPVLVLQAVWHKMPQVRPVQVQQVVLVALAVQAVPPPVGPG